MFHNQSGTAFLTNAQRVVFKAILTTTPNAKLISTITNKTLGTKQRRKAPFHTQFLGKIFGKKIEQFQHFVINFIANDVDTVIGNGI